MLAWRIPWIEEPGGLWSMGSLESDTTEPSTEQKDKMLGTQKRGRCFRRRLHVGGKARSGPEGWRGVLQVD